ncbi:hypothetical protein DL95DRAFT_469845 [Leptodontidium sp. 2 PMI_412]|nr:hypothetical protein DL95DRAFT_469845 [Leptodontidium sp. 2 PMI_412]
MAAIASTSATFKYPTTINACYTDGSGSVCVTDEGIQKLDVFLFIAALVIFVINLKKQRSSGSSPDAVANESKLKAQMQPMNPQTYEQVPQQ